MTTTNQNQDESTRKKKKDKNHSEMTFFEHLGELRKRILFSVSFIFVFFIASWGFVDHIYDFLAVPVLSRLPQGKTLVYTSLTEPFMMKVKLAFITGLFISVPFIFYQLWRFIAPALYPKEKRWVFPFVFFTSLFFISGGAFGYYYIFPVACDFFIKMGEGFEAMLTIENYFSLEFRVLIGIALIFELPVLVFLLARLRILTAGFLWKYFKYSIVIIFVIAAIITPTPDMVTQSMFAGPMILLYILSIFIAKVAAPKD